MAMQEGITFVDGLVFRIVFIVFGTLITVDKLTVYINSHAVAVSSRLFGRRRVAAASVAAEPEMKSSRWTSCPAGRGFTTDVTERTEGEAEFS